MTFGCPSSSPKHIVFRFHETILSFGEPGSLLYKWTKKKQCFFPLVSNLHFPPLLGVALAGLLIGLGWCRQLWKVGGRSGLVVAWDLGQLFWLKSSGMKSVENALQDLPWRHETSTMNEDVDFPAESGDFPPCHVSFQAGVFIEIKAF